MYTIDELIQDELNKIDTDTIHPDLKKYYTNKKFDSLTIDILYNRTTPKDLKNHKKRTYRTPLEQFDSEYYNRSKNWNKNNDWWMMEEEWDRKKQKREEKDIQIYLSYLEHEILTLQKLMPQTQLNNWLLQNIIQENLQNDINEKIELMEKQLYQLQKYKLSQNK